MQESTLNEYIEERKDDDLHMDKLFFKELNNYNSSKAIYLSDSIIMDYLDELSEIVEIYECDNDDYDKYMCNPKRLCWDLYGNINLWSLILDLNGVASCSQFTMRNIKVYGGEIVAMLNSILNLEEEEINSNEEEISEE